MFKLAALEHQALGLNILGNVLVGLVAVWLGTAAGRSLGG